MVEAVILHNQNHEYHEDGSNHRLDKEVAKFVLVLVIAAELEFHFFRPVLLAYPCVEFLNFLIGKKAGGDISFYKHGWNTIQPVKHIHQGLNIRLQEVGHGNLTCRSGEFDVPYGSD